MLSSVNMMEELINEGGLYINLYDPNKYKKPKFNHIPFQSLAISLLEQ